MTSQLICPCGSEDFELFIEGEPDSPDEIKLRCTECGETMGWVLERAYDA